MATLSLCVICKNEEKNIGKLLESVKGTLFDEIIIVDTGSQDKTVEIAKKYTSDVHFFEWINDFSAARNYAFSKATKDYIMWLDSDDEIKPVDYQKLLSLKNRLHEAPMWLCKYEYAHDQFGNSICSFFRERIVKRSLNLQWQDPIHEYLPLVDGFQKTDIEVHHYKIHSSSDRNIPLLEKLVEKKPEARIVYYLAKEYYDVGNMEKAIPLLTKFVEMPGAWGENKYAACFRLISHYLVSKNYPEATKYCFKAIETEPLKAEAYCLFGDVYWGTYHNKKAQGVTDTLDVKKAIHFYSIAANMPRPDHILDLVEPKYYTWLPHLQMCVFYNEIGEVLKAATHNEIALTFLPKDSRLLSNQKIFKNHLKERYPDPQKQSTPATAQEEAAELQEAYPSFRGKIGWKVPENMDAGTIRIRTLNIHKALKEKGFDSEMYDASKEDSYDYVVIGKNYSASEQSLVQRLKSKNIRVISDLSEDILAFPYVLEILKASDLVICCSEELRKKVAPHNSSSIVIEDGVESFVC